MNIGDEVRIANFYSNRRGQTGRVARFAGEWTIVTFPDGAEVPYLGLELRGSRP